MKVNIGKYFKTSPDRKISVTIEDFDTWSLDHTLAWIILPALLQLKNTKQGIPSEFAEVGGEDYQSQMCFDFYSETRDDAFTVRAKEWETILDKMIWSFKQLAFSDYEQKYHHNEEERDYVKGVLGDASIEIEDKFKNLGARFGHYWYDYVGQQLHEERIQEGLELFGKYYRNLWD